MWFRLFVSDAYFDSRWDPLLAIHQQSGYIIEQLKLPFVGFLTSSTFPSKCYVERGVPHYPLRIYGNKDVVIFIGYARTKLSSWPREFQFKDASVTHDVVSLILDFAVRHKCAAVVTSEGLPKDEYFSEPGHKVQLQYITTSEDFSKYLSDTEHTKVEVIFF